jgi:ubiquinone/menaquinone biosynthesis C-methylase UbiE
MSFYADRVLPHVLNCAMRNRDLLPFRQRLLAEAGGRVLEIGVGSGLNLPLYTDRATEVIGLDPHPKLLQMAARRHAIVPSRIVEGFAEAIPLEDASIDTVVSTWTLCTIPAVTPALAEMRRVLKPGGRLLFVEHGLSPDPKVCRWQHRLTPLWKRIGGGCHLNRAIPELLRSAGFEIAQMTTSYLRGPKPMTFTYEGWARPTAPR